MCISTFRYYFRVPVAAKLRELISKLLFLGVLSRNFTLGINKWLSALSLQHPRFLAFLSLISFHFREDQGYPNLKLSTRTREGGPYYSDLKLSKRTTGILVCMGTDFLWKFDRVYRRWDAFCVNRWHSIRIYTRNQGTEKRRDTNPKLLTWTTGILVCLGTDFLWKFDGVYRRWDAFCVNRWHSIDPNLHKKSGNRET